jgi:hypothetical protein
MNKKGTIQNLKAPWKKGESGNPSGRPKKRPVTDEYFALADIEVPKEICKALKVKYVPGRTFSQWNALRRFMDCMLKDGHRAAKEVREAMEGKAPQRIDLTGTQTVEQILRVVFEKRLKSSE